MSADHFLQENKELISAMERAAILAAKQMLELIHSDKELKIQRKADQTLVMNLDWESQATILPILEGLLPIVSEEQEQSYSLLETEDSYFLVDPLDGTTSCKRFMKSEAGQVGFGPIIGLVLQGSLTACCYFNMPSKTLFTAVEGCGTSQCRSDLLLYEDLTPVDLRPKLIIEKGVDLNNSAMLFAGRALLEGRYAGILKSSGIIETAYKFGGFGNDCSRLAQAYEEIILSFTPKAWDYSAVLLAAEAGLRVVVDPLGDAVDYREWRIRDSNPVLVGHEHEINVLLEEVKKLSLAND